METEGRANRVGAKAIAVPGNLMAWCEIAQRFGKLDLPTLMEPAIRLASRGFAVTPYLATCIAETASDLALDPAIAAIFMPQGTPLAAGESVSSIRLCRNAAHHRAVRSWRDVRRRTWPRHRRQAGAGRIVHPGGGSGKLQDHRAAAGARHLSRCRDHRSAAAVFGWRAYHPDSQHPGSLRYRRTPASVRRRRCIWCWRR